MAELTPRIRRPIDNSPRYIEAPPIPAPAPHIEVPQAPAPSPPPRTPARTHTQIANIVRYAISLTRAINARKHKEGLTISCGSCNNKTHMAYHMVYLLAALFMRWHHATRRT